MALPLLAAFGGSSGERAFGGFAPKPPFAQSIKSHPKFSLLNRHLAVAHTEILHC